MVELEQMRRWSGQVLGRRGTACLGKDVSWSGPDRCGGGWLEALGRQGGSSVVVAGAERRMAVAGAGGREAVEVVDSSVMVGGVGTVRTAVDIHTPVEVDRNVMEGMEGSCSNTAAVGVEIVRQ